MPMTLPSALWIGASYDQPTLLGGAWSPRRCRLETTRISASCGTIGCSSATASASPRTSETSELSEEPIFLSARARSWADFTAALMAAMSGRCVFSSASSCHSAGTGSHTRCKGGCWPAVSPSGECSQLSSTSRGVNGPSIACIWQRTWCRTVWTARLRSPDGEEQ